MTRKEELIQVGKEIENIKNKTTKSEDKITVLTTDLGDFNNLDETIKTNLKDNNLINAINYVYENGKGGAESFEYPNVTNLLCKLGDNKGKTINISWVNPKDINEFQGVELYVKDTDISHMDLDYCRSNATLIIDKKFDNATFNGEYGKTYYFKVFTKYVVLASFKYADGIATNILCYNTDKTPPNTVTNLNIVAENKQITLTWTNPKDEDFEGVKVVRKIGNYPTNINDGDLIYNGKNTSYTDSGLVNGTIYYYRFFTYDDNNNYNNSTENQQTSATPSESKEYGIRWTKSIDKVERLGNAIGLTATTGGKNDFDNLYPWSEIKRCNLNTNGQVVAYYGDSNYIEDGTYQCMVEIPKFWFKMVNVSNDILECWICEKPKDGYILHPAFYRCRNKVCDDQSGVAEEVDYRYRSSYLCSEVNGRAVSTIGVLPKASITIGDSRKLCKANGNGWGLLDYNLFYATQLLYLIEYADFDSQSKLGRGYVDGNSSAIQTGGTSSLGNKSGNQGNNGTDGKHQVSYRGIEDIWGNCRCWIDGFYCDSNRNVLIGNKGFNDNGSGYKSYLTGLSSNVGGYIGDVFSNNELGFVIKNDNGSATSKLYDYGYLGASYLPIAGGCWVDGSDAGAFCFACFCSAASASSAYSLSLAF